MVFIIALMCVASIAAYSYFGANGGTNGGAIPVGFEIEESIDLSYDQWSVGINYAYTYVRPGEDNSIVIGDASNAQVAKATLHFNDIDIGIIKMQICAPRDIAQNYFAMEFRSGDTTLFKLERIVNDFTFVVLSNTPITLVDLGSTYQTFEIFFDLSDGINGKVSVDLDGVNKVDEFSFDPNNMEIDNIYMHTLVKIYRSKTAIKFESLYNLQPI